MSLISDILYKYKTPQAILQLPSNVRLDDVSIIRSSYKRLALLLHPDKNKDKDAEEAFKKVSEAYEQILSGKLNKKKISTSSKSQTDHKTSFHSSKRKRSTIPGKKRSRPRTAKEIWEAFEQEEEEFIRKQMLRKEQLQQRKHTKQQEKLKFHEERIQLEKQDLFETNLEEKANQWNHFQKPLENSNSLPIDNFNCLLCRRKFRSLEHLQRHEKLSNIHQQNLRKQEIQEALEEL